MANLWKTVFSEIKNTVLDRNIIIVLTAGPILLTILIGGIYLNTYVEDMPIVILDEDNSSLSRMIVQQFEESDRFVITRAARSGEELQEVLNSGEALMGIHIPSRFAQDIANLRTPRVLAIVNGANTVTGNTCFAEAATIVNTVAAGIQIKMIQARGVMPAEAEKTVLAFGFTDRVLYDPRMKYMNYLILGLISIFMQQLFLSGFGFSVIKDGKRISGQFTMPKILLKFFVCSGFLLVSSYAVAEIAVGIFKVPVRGNLWIAALLLLAFLLALSCPALLIAAITRDRLKYAQICFMLSLPTFVSSGYVWPSDHMPYTMQILIKSFWPLIHFARPVDELLLKNMPFSSVAGSLANMLLYTVIWMPAAVMVYKKRFMSATEVVDSPGKSLHR